MITAAAIRLNGINYSLPAPCRHKDIIRALTLDDLEPDLGEQGFLEEDGNFLTRQEAAFWAYYNDQIKDWHHGQELNTEDLW